MTSIKDRHGNVVIQQGLKVRHKESQYEYTVEDILQDEGEEITVILNLPEEPRFDPPSKNGVISDAVYENTAIYEYDVPDQEGDAYFEPESSENENDGMIAVSQKEFEKEYEVR
jgi:hypothetical protein